jgi:methanogenic corrinoid protein MtbC1
MSSVRQLVELERWSVAPEEGGWKSSVSMLPQALKSRWTDNQRRVLEDTVEREIIPRLLAGRNSDEKLQMSSGALAREVARPTAWDVAELVRLVSRESTGMSVAYVRRITSQGVPLNEIFLHLLAPAAHLLGEMWVDDTADFATVTIATSRLQQLLREFAPEFQSPARIKRCGTRALLVAIPGDQHTFGVSMLQEFFRSDGWAVSSDIPQSWQDLVGLAGAEPFKLIGISVSCDAAPDELRSLIKDVRRAAVDPACRIVVGGRLFLAQPDLVRVVGADGMATDAQTATRQLSSLLDTKAV